MAKPVLFLICAASTLLLTAVISRYLIPVLRSHKMGQRILEVGPRWHKNKEGTPTMGGVAFITASAIVFIPAAVYVFVSEGASGALPMLYTVAFAFINAAIGVKDDLSKLKKKQNEGLTARAKFLLQLIAAGLYLFAMSSAGAIDTSVYIPYAGIELELGVFYYAAALVLLTGIVNAVNLTDGIDGLSSMVTLVVGVFFTLAAFISGAAVDTPLAVVSSLLIGSTAGFLIYNYYPARVFMGDTGSLFLGALVVGCAFLAGNPLIIVIAGFVYIAETVSVIIQVLYFKATHGKRFFKMAPIHHHFEMCGWSELKIDFTFAAATALACVGAWFGLA